MSSFLTIELNLCSQLSRNGNRSFQLAITDRLRVRSEFRLDHHVRPDGKGAGTALDQNGLILELLPRERLDGFAEFFLTKDPAGEKLTRVDDLHRLNREGFAAATAFGGV